MAVSRASRVALLCLAVVAGLAVAVSAADDVFWYKGECPPCSRFLAPPSVLSDEALAHEALRAASRKVRRGATLSPPFTRGGGRPKPPHFPAQTKVLANTPRRRRRQLRACLLPSKQLSPHLNNSQTAASPPGTSPRPR